MTNEEAIEQIKILKAFIGYDEDNPIVQRIQEALDMVIKALEQQPIIDKIRVEIEALSNANPSYWHSGDMVDRDDVLEILDKYIEGSEENDE